MTTVWRVVFVTAGTMLALLALSVPFVDPDSGTAVIAVLSAAMLLVTMLGAGLLARAEWDPF